MLGSYEGHHDYNTSTTVYYSIPYAHAARFEAPRSIETKDGLMPHALVNASTHGPACINFNLPPPYDTSFRTVLGSEPLAPQQEDCLNLDVYVPDGPHQDLPVLFYIPGGGFLVAASFSYDMGALLSHANALGKPFIAVVINYRLGPLGLLNPSNAKDWNVGVLDQFEALHYVQRHIHKFGGDPNKVTISKCAVILEFHANKTSGPECRGRVRHAPSAVGRAAVPGRVDDERAFFVSLFVADG